MAEKEKILIIGATGYIGKFLVEASAKARHPTFALIRESTASSPEKSKVVESFRGLGVTVIYGDLYDQESLVRAIEQVDVVISAVASAQVADQANIIAAIKEVGNGRIKRFLPSEFGEDVDRMDTLEPFASMSRAKAQFRRTIEAEGIPYTFIVSNFFAGYSLPKLGQLHANVTTPPRDEVSIPGDGNTKSIFVVEEDIAAYTIKSATDPRLENKILHLRPPANILSLSELVSLWEKKIGKTLERTYIPDDLLLKNIQEAPPPTNFILAIEYSVFVKGACSDYEIEPSSAVEASKLYPEVKYTTVDEYLTRFL